MRQIFLFIISIIITSALYAQEPGNNLRKTISQIRQEFPNLKYNRNDKGYDMYNSAAEDRDFTSFYFKNGILVGEYTYIFDYSGSSYIHGAISESIIPYARNNLTPFCSFVTYFFRCLYPKYRKNYLLL